MRPRGTSVPSSAAVSIEITVLAQGLWLKTERINATVVRFAQPWCPSQLARFLLHRLIANAGRFGAYLPVPALSWDSCRQAVVQQYVEDARPVRQLSAAEVRGRRTARALCDFWRAAEECWWVTGWLPDLGGKVYLPWELYQPLQTDNVVVDAQGDCWLVDVGASALFHRKDSPFGRIHGSLMLRAIRRCRDQLQLTERAEM